VIDENRSFPARDRQIGFVQEGGDPQAPGRTSPAQFASGEAMEFRVQGPEQGIRDHTFVASSAWHFGSSVHHSTYLLQLAAATASAKTSPLFTIGNGGEKATRPRLQHPNR
jgi:hypothetical protein